MTDLVIKRGITPEDRELASKKAELEQLETILAQRELDLLTLEVQLREFEHLYLGIVGTLYVELDEVEAKIAEAKAALAPHDKDARRKAAEARAQAEESAYTTGSIKDTKPQERFRPSDSLKKLYRELARLLHPDLVFNDEEKAKRHQLMAKANKAYEDGDEELLAQMLEEQKCSPNVVEGNGIGAELVRFIRQIAQAKDRLKLIDKEFVSLEQSDLFELRSKVDDAKREGRDLLKEIAVQVEEQIVVVQQRLADLELA